MKIGNENIYLIFFSGVELICFHSVIVVIRPSANNTRYEFTPDIIIAPEVSLMISGYVSMLISPTVRKTRFINTLANDKSKAGIIVMSMS